MRRFWTPIVEPLLERVDQRVVLVVGNDPLLRELLSDYAATQNIDVRFVDGSDGDLMQRGVGLVLVDDATPGMDVGEALETSLREDLAQLPLVVIGGADPRPTHDATRAALDRVLERAGDRVEEINVPGFGGVTLLIPREEELPPDLAAFLDGWRMAGPVREHLQALERARVEAGRAAETPTDVPSAASVSDDAEADALRERVQRAADDQVQLLRRATDAERRLEAQRTALEAVLGQEDTCSAPQASDSGRGASSEQEVRDRYAQLLEMAPAPLDEPMPLDVAGRVRPLEELRAGSGLTIQVVLHAGSDVDRLRRAALAILRHTTHPVAVTVSCDGASDEVVRWVRELPQLIPGMDSARSPVPADWTVEIDDGVEVVPGWLERLLEESERHVDASVLYADAPGGLPSWLPEPAAGLTTTDPTVTAATPAPRVRATRTTESAYDVDVALDRVVATCGDAPAPDAGWPAGPDQMALTEGPQRLAFVLAGALDDGSGATQSIVQQAAALNAMGIEAAIHVPSETLPRAYEAYAAHRELFVAYERAAQLRRRLEHTPIVIATEARAVRLVREALAGRSDASGFYYIQDDEPLCAPEGSLRAEEAVASYRALGGGKLLAETDWLCNAIAVAHGVEVHKVEPSLDRAVFRSAAREPSDGRAMRIVGMVRARTARCRPAQTVAALRRAVRELGAEVVTFGCPVDELIRVAGPDAGVDHRGSLLPEAVADLLRWADVFVDLSIYQAFGRAGLEARACGCVPLLPRWGGAGEFAIDGDNALLVDGGDAEAVAEALASLDADRERLAAMSKAGLETASMFSAERAALSVCAAVARADVLASTQERAATA